MHESPSDITRLQDLLDRSYASAGAHLLSIHTPERRMSAEQLSRRLTGMCLLTLVTVTSDGRPVADGDYVSLDLVSTVDGEEVEGGSAKGLSYEVGSGDLIDGLDDAIVGKQARELFDEPVL